jgi:hypothetical protein
LEESLSKDRSSLTSESELFGLDLLIRHSLVKSPFLHLIFSLEKSKLLKADLPVAGMEDWDFTQGFYYGLSQEAKEHIDNLAGGTFFLLKTQEVRSLFKKITASARESEEYDSKENSRATKIDPLTQKF